MTFFKGREVKENALIPWTVGSGVFVLLLLYLHVFKRNVTSIISLHLFISLIMKGEGAGI